MCKRRKGNETEMTNTGIKYEDKYVCFIDILGFKNAIIHSTHSIQDIEEALRTMEEDMKKKELFFRGPSIIQVSDSIIVSCPIESNNLYYFIDIIVQLQQDLLFRKFPTRGAITKGEIYHDGNRIFGPAYSQAVELEGKAKFPVVTLSEEVAQAFHEIDGQKSFSEGFDNQFKFLLKNVNLIDILIDNKWFKGINFIKNWSISRYSKDLSDLKIIIEKGLGIPDYHIQEKYNWLACGFNKYLVKNAIAEFGETAKKFTISTMEQSFFNESNPSLIKL